MSATETDPSASRSTRASATGMMPRSTSITRCAEWMAISGVRNSVLASSKLSLRTCDTYSGSKRIHSEYSARGVRALNPASRVQPIGELDQQGVARRRREDVAIVAAEAEGAVGHES